MLFVFPTMMSPFRSWAGSSVMHIRPLWPGPMWLKAKTKQSEPVIGNTQTFTENSNSKLKSPLN